MKQISSLKSEVFGHVEGREITLFTLSNSKGMKVGITNFGGLITFIKIPYKGSLIDAVLGFDTLEEYLDDYYRSNYPYFGAIIGRNAGRVRNAVFMLDGNKIELPQNLKPHHLHGGNKGFDSRVWDIEEVDKDNLTIVLKYLSKDGEEGYPGNLTTLVTYKLTEDNELQVYYQAETDAPTVVNLTQHSYFNFNKDSKKITNHTIQINSSKCLPLNKDLIPIGIAQDVDSCNLDFRTSKPIPSEIDNSFVRFISEDEVLGTLECEDTGIKMEVKTNYPILHIYGGYYAPELTPNNNRKRTGRNAGVCFEAQKYPDALNHPLFPTNRLAPGEEYKYHTYFKFYF